MSDVAPVPRLSDGGTPDEIAAAVACWCWWEANHAECPANRIPTAAELAAWLPECPADARAEAAELLAPLFDDRPAAWELLTTDGAPSLFGMVQVDRAEPGAMLMPDAAGGFVPVVGRCLRSVHALWRMLPEPRPRHPLAPLVGCWQMLAPVTVEVDRRPSGILPVSLRTAHREHADRLPLALDVQTPMGAAPGAQAHLPGLEPPASALVPVLPLALYDLAGGAMQTRGRGAPVAQRLFFEVLMSVGRLDRAPGRTARVESSYRELVAWLWPNLRGRRTWERSRHLPALYGALLELDGMRIEWERQLWRLVGVTALPTAATRPDDPAVFRVEHLPGSERGPMIDREALRRFGTVSAPAWRAYLRLAYLWDRAKAQNGGRRIYATRPKVERARDGVLIGRDGRPVTRKDGRPVRDWSDARAVRLYGPNGEPLTERNPQADRVPILGPDDRRRLAYDDDLDTNRNDRLRKAREALDAMEAAGAVVIEPDGAGGMRLLEPPPAPE